MARRKTTGFDDEIFRKEVALFDSPEAGEAENAFRKAVLLCAKYGLRFCDAVGMAFGGSDSGEVARLQAQLQQQERETADQLEEAAEHIQYLESEVQSRKSHAVKLEAALMELERADACYDYDVRLWLRRVWQFPKVRLALLTAWMALSIVAPPIFFYRHPFLFRGWQAGFFGLFALWSLAQFRKRGFGPMCMKWVVYFGFLYIGSMALDGLGVDDPRADAGVLLAGMVLTLSRFSELVRVKVWESGPARRVRKCF